MPQFTRETEQIAALFQVHFREGMPERMRGQTHIVDPRDLFHQQEQKREQGLPFFWNGSIYALDRFVIGREPTNEDMTLDLWFRPSDYYTFLATNMSLREPALRGKYLSDVDWNETIPYFSNSFGVSLAVITTDGYILFTQRGKSVGTRPKVYDVGIVEGLSRPIDRGTSGEAPDVYRCACRGLSEELGLVEKRDFSVSDILFLGLGLDTEYYMCGLRGVMKSHKTANEIIKNWQIGVKDKMENRKLFAIPFTLEDVCKFVFSHGPWGGGALMGIYHTLVYEFGREAVERVLSSY